MNAKKIAFGGIVSAIIIIFTYVAGIIPSGRLSVYAAASFFVAAVIIECGVRTAVLTYIASSAIAALIVPKTIWLIFYLLFFAHYGLLKYFIERVANIVWQWSLKITVFVAEMLLIYAAASFMFADSFSVMIKSYVFAVYVVFGMAIFVLYDLVYTKVIIMYRKKFQGKIIKGGNGFV